MTYLRWLRFLDRVSHILRRLPFKDRWGFNLGDDLCDWLSFKELIYMEHVTALHRERFEPVEVSIGPPCNPEEGFHAGSNIRITWPEPGGSCDKCGSITYTSGALAN